MKTFFALTLVIALAWTATADDADGPTAPEPNAAVSSAENTDLADAETLPTHSPVDGSVTYIIPVRGMIQSGMLFAIDRQLERARKAGADVIVLHMDTPGGVLVTAERMMRMLMELPDDIKTYTFVDKDALSAGALIAMATDAIYMAPQSRIGASALVTLFGDLDEGDTKEKSYSASMALVKSIASSKGYDPDMVEAMMRKEFEYKIGDEILCPEGRLLTLTETEAARIVERDGQSVPLLSSGTAKDLDAFLELIGRSDSKIVIPMLTPTENLVRYAKMIAIFFLIGGVLGVYIEFRTPGFGVPGVLGLFFFMLFFWAQNVAGTAGTIEVLIFIVGLGLLLLEIFVIPGFGLAGITGLVLMGGAVFGAMVRRIPGESGWFAFPDMQISDALVRLGIAVIASGAGMVLLTKMFTLSPAFSHIALLKALDHEGGYEASDKTDHLVGAQGQTKSMLRPAGIALFDGKPLNVIARGEFIEPNTPIRIVEAHGNRLVVEIDQERV